jgi:hypothetical protein
MLTRNPDGQTHHSQYFPPFSKDEMQCFSLATMSLSIPLNIMESTYSNSSLNFVLKIFS